MKMLSRLNKIAIAAFPFMVFVSYAMSAIETYTYVGALHRYIFFNSYQVVLATILMGIAIIVTNNRRQITNSYIDLTLKFNILLVIPILLGYYTLVAAETLHYPNYVFSTYHVQPDNFLNFLYINSFCLVMYFYVYKIAVSIDVYSETKKIINKLKRNKFALKDVAQLRNWKAVLALGLVIMALHYGIDNFTRTLHRGIKETTFILTHPMLNDQEKYRYGWAFVYDYFSFIKDHTPEDAVIAFPPAQNHWLTTGNTVVVRYFLYPRKIVNVKETQNVETLYQMPIEYDYVAIAKGEWDDPSNSQYGWPKQDIAADEIWFYNPENGSVMNDNAKIYKPNENNNELKWGLIKVKK